MAKKRPLGPLQDVWDAWTPMQDFVDGIPYVYFENVLRIQLNEIEDHHNAGEQDKIDKEIVDIMSVCLNWFRSRGLSDQDVADAIKARTNRFADVQAICDSYNERYGL